MPRFVQSVTGLLNIEPWFNPRKVDMGFVVDKVTLACTICEISKFEIYVNFILRFKITYLMPEGGQYDRNM
jgi:hypothetical protein